MEQHSNTFSKLTLIGIGLISLVLIYFFIWRVDAVGYKTVIDGDGKDYYSYLMSIFIDKNLGHQNASPWYVIQTESGTINVHTIGVSLLLLPFFALAYLWALLSGAELNGVSEPFQKMISLGALTYTLFGLYYLRNVLLERKISEKVISLMLIIIFFGTNLLNYSLNEPCMSHVYSFFLIAAFLHMTQKLFSTFQSKYFWLTGLILGLIILVRPINGIVVLLLPLWSDSWSEFVLKIKFILKERKMSLAISKIVFALTVFLQSVVWFFQNGKWIQWSYKDNGLYLLNPSPMKMLFGFNSGFFIYTPIILLLILGLIPMYLQNKFQFLVFTLFLLFTFYLFSSHWAYTYFDGLGIRALVDFYALFAVIGAALLMKVSQKSKFTQTTTGMALAFTFVFSLIFNYQYKAGILPPAGMNYNKFSYIFLKTKQNYAGVLGGSNDLLPYAKVHPQASLVFENNFGDTAFEYDTTKEFGVEYRVPELGFNTSKIYVKVKFKRKEITLHSSQEALLVLNIESKDKVIKNYQVFKLNETPASFCCEWQEWNYAITMDGKIKADDLFIVYIWNKEKGNFLVDDFKVEVFNYNYNS